jgi:anti-anti-sigma factor
MPIETATQGQFIILRPAGRLDSTTSTEFEAAVLAAIGTGQGHVVANLAAVPYVSSAGLRVFLLGAKRSKEAGGRFVLCHVSPTVQNVLQLAGFLRLIAVVPTEAGAIAQETPS